MKFVRRRLDMHKKSEYENHKDTHSELCHYPKRNPQNKTTWRQRLNAMAIIFDHDIPNLC